MGGVVDNVPGSSHSTSISLSNAILWGDNDWSTPEGYLLTLRVQHRHLAVVSAGRETSQRYAEPQRNGFGSRIEPLSDCQRGRLERLQIAAIEGDERDQRLRGDGR